MLNNLVRLLALLAMSWIITIAPVAAASCESIAALNLPGGKITPAVWRFSNPPRPFAALPRR